MSVKKTSKKNTHSEKISETEKNIDLEEKQKKNEQLKQQPKDKILDQNSNKENINNIQKEKEKFENKQSNDEDKKKKEEQEKFDAFRKAGEIAKKVKDFIRPQLKPGVKILDIIEIAESKILELGGKVGFPVNICLNHIAAHYTPPPGDNSIISDGDIVKFDMGVHIDGYPVDTAFTLNFNTNPELKDITVAAEEAVKVAISLIKPGMKTNHIGRKIEETVKKYGFRPIKDLMGHKIERWNLHAGKSIPCISLPPGSGDTIEEGEVYAIEVFVTNGEGTIHSQQNAQIYSLTPQNIPLRNRNAKKIYSYITQNYKTLPFSRYQIYKQFPKEIFGLMEIIKSNKVIEHKILSEKKGREIYIAQAEETVLVTKDGCEILT